MKAFCQALCIALCCLPLTLVKSIAEPRASDDTLLSLAHSLHCAPNSGSAEVIIRQIQYRELLAPGLPIESTVSPIPSLRASSLDRLLFVLYASSNTYPEHKNQIEQAVIRWNFCSIIDSGKFYDHASTDGKLSRLPSSGSSNDWQGFRSFGLIPGTENGSVFDFTTPYKNSIIKSLADQRHMQRYINHCLPHPDNEHLYRGFGRYFISRVTPGNTPLDIPKDEWTHECGKEEPVVVTDVETFIEMPPPSTENSRTVYVAPPYGFYQNINPDRTVAKPAAALPADVMEQEPITSTDDLIDTGSDITPDPIEITSNSNVVSNEGFLGKSDSDSDNLDLTIEQLTPSPVVITGLATGSAASTDSNNNSKGLSGSIALENKSFRIRDTSIKLAVSYSPLKNSYWFVRSALNISQQSNPFTYSWGIGYDDWHPGTWAVQLNHWGPLQFGDGLDLDNAVAEVSYKFKGTWLKKHNLGSSIGLSKPISDKPVLSWGWSWNPYSDWFVRSTLVKPLDSGELNWSYGFGFTRYTPSSFSIEYNNWGINSFPKTNFKKNGQLSLIYRWQY